MTNPKLHTLKFTTGEVAIVRALLERMCKSGKGGAATAADTALEKVKVVKLVDYNHVGRESTAAGRTHRINQPGVRRNPSGKRGTGRKGGK